MRRPLAAAVLGLCGLGAVACGGTAVSHAADTGASGVPRSSAASQAAGQHDAAQDASQDAAKAAPGSAREASSSAANAKPLAGKVIVIDPGHNGGNFRHPEVINRQVDILTQKKACDTTGTSTNDGYSEAAYTWDVSNRLARLLRAQGATVILTRKNNTGAGPCITERAAVGNRAKADAAISIHADGAPASAHGFHVIMPKKIHGPVDRVVGASKRLGVAVRDAFHTGTGIAYSTYIGTKALNFRSDLGGLNLSTVPKIFIECGNMRNAGDAARFKNTRFRQRIAVALGRGLEDYLAA
ncbi:N-acetylmuramoyl-L-alanine amidase [Microbispora sp. RL4-1S]|uniref:N-acetylmuramoyl-L-alanine amidase n=1 Tax=Microbispora oryzae TaxID=2806554 RepID=A0A941AKJ1_9ACTN|nr:N-acetylmuramoyl-L-alanine amidase [Microbispora oryzae]